MNEGKHGVLREKKGDWNDPGLKAGKCHCKSRQWADDEGLYKTYLEM